MSFHTAEDISPQPVKQLHEHQHGDFLFKLTFIMFLYKKVLMKCLWKLCRFMEQQQSTKRFEQVFLKRQKRFE